MITRTLALATLLVGCSTGPTAEPLQGTRWQLVELAGAAVAPIGTATSAGHLRFDGDSGRFAASAGCNQMGGRWTIDTAGLRFGQVMSTLMACEEPLMSRERALSEALAATSSYAIAADRLELRAGETVLAAFARDTTTP